MSASLAVGSTGGGKRATRHLCGPEGCREPVQGKQTSCGIRRRAVELGKKACEAGGEQEKADAFRAIFGDKGGATTPELAKEVVGRHSTKKRKIHATLSQLIMPKVSNAPQKKRNAGKWTLTLLCGWGESQALQEWKALEVDPTVGRDQLGATYNPLHLRTLTWSFGESASIERVKGYESKELSTHAKAIVDEGRAGRRRA